MTEKQQEKTCYTAAPDMLEALEEVVAITENLPVCPFCGAVKTVQSHSTDCLSHEIETAIRKARGGESPMTRETKAVGLLHRVLDYFLGGIAFPEKMERMLGEIEAYLTEIEAEERDALRK